MSRAYLTQAELVALGAELTEREAAVLKTVAELRLVSGGQLQRLHFPADSVRHRRRVLASMVARRLLARLERTVGGRRPGSSEYLYVLGTVGQRLTRPDGPRGRHPGTPGPAFVAHALAVSELAVRLSEAERRSQVEVLEFTAEPACWRSFPGPGGGRQMLKPDAAARLALGQFEDSWFIEVDRDSESMTTIGRKLDVYRRYWASGIEQGRRGVFPRTLWLVPTERRYRELVDACARQPAEAWQLHQVTLYENFLPTVTEGAA